MAFLWFGRRDTDEIPYTKQPSRRPKYIDYTDGLTADVELTRGIYHNTYNGFKLAGGLAYPVIALPVYFMGFPVLKTDNERLKETASEMTDMFVTQMQQIHTQCHREGTLWVWPKYDSKNQEVLWEFIRDDVVSDIIRTLDTNEIVEIYTEEQMLITTGNNTTETVTRKRHFTKTIITESYTGASVAAKLKSTTRRNVLGIIPIVFANNVDGGDIRGHSDLERIISLLKNYHDISLAEFKILAKFKPKMIQSVEPNKVGDWLANNGGADFSTYEPESVDLIINTTNEDTKFEIPTSMTSEHREAKRQIFEQIVQSEGIPEIVFGLKTSGNHASIEEQFATFAQYISDKQRQKNEPYLTLFEATLRLILKSQLNQDNLGELSIEWNDLDTMSEKVQSEIFNNYATGFSKLVDSASATEEQLYKWWVALYPAATEDDFEKWKVGIRQMANHKTFKDASYSEILGAAGLVTDESMEEELTPKPEGDTI